MEFKENCKGCIECCGILVPIEESEFKMLKRLFKGQLKENYFKKFDEASLNGELYTSCPFIDLEKNNCSIYSLRPKICKGYHCNPNKSKLLKINASKTFANLLSGARLTFLKIKLSEKGII